MATIQYYGTGRRKTAVARVYLRPGTGKITVNKRDFEVYFPNRVLKMIIRQPLLITETADKFDILVNVDGGGHGRPGRRDPPRPVAGPRGLQPGAAAALKRAGFLTRDAREVERKKYGQPKARRRFQFSKR